MQSAKILSHRGDIQHKQYVVPLSKGRGGGRIGKKKRKITKTKNALKFRTNLVQGWDIVESCQG